LKVVLATSARDDLGRIGDYIAADNPSRARSFLRELREAARRIGDTPRGFALIPRYEHHGIRRRPYRDYLIFYRVEETRVVVIHILHGAQDFVRVLFGEE